MRRALAILTPVVLVLGCSLSGLDDYSAQWDAGATSDGAPPPDAAAEVVVKDAVAEPSPDGPPPPCNRAAPFGGAGPVTSLNTSSTIDGAAALSPDQLTVYFISDRLGQGSNLFTASRADTKSQFGTIAPLASLNFSGADTWNATLTADLKTAYIVTDQGAADHMYVTTRASTLVAFNTPTQIAPPLGDGRQPFILPDGTALYTSDTAKKQITRTQLGQTPSSQNVVLSFGTPTEYGIPVVNADETIMYFSVFKTGVFASYDIWVTTRAKTSDPWGAPTPVTELNTAEFDAPSWVSADGCTLYYTHAPANGTNWDIWSAKKP